MRRLPKGLFEKNKKIWIRYYDPLSRRTREISSRLDVTTDNIKKARAMREEIIKAYKTPQNVPVKSYLKISEALEMYLQDKSYAESTVLIARLSVKYFIDSYGDMIITNITNNHVKQLYAEWSQKFSINSCSIYSRAIYVFFNWLVRNKYLEHNPFTTIPVHKKEVKAIPKEDIQLILDTLQKENVEGYYLIKFLYLTGLRISEAISLKWENVDFEKGLLKFWNQKSKRFDTRPLLQPALELLKEIRVNTNREDKVFLHSDRSCRFFYRLQARLWGERDAKGRLKKKTLHKYHIHQLRKTFISNLIAHGVSLEDTQVFSGHRDPRTTLAHYVEFHYQKVADRVNKLVSF